MSDFQSYLRTFLHNHVIKRRDSNTSSGGNSKGQDIGTLQQVLLLCPPLWSSNRSYLSFCIHLGQVICVEDVEEDKSDEYLSHLNNLIDLFYSPSDEIWNDRNNFHSFIEALILVLKQIDFGHVNATQDLFLATFLMGLTEDIQGRRITVIWKFSIEDYEYCHDYIQMIFPNAEMSRFNPDAPLVTNSLLSFLNLDSVLYSIVQDNMRKSFCCMLEFWGVAESQQNNLTRSFLALLGQVDSSNPLTCVNMSNESNWIQRSHNHLRMSRVLHALNIFQLDKEFQLLFQYLISCSHKHSNYISSRTKQFWGEINTSHQNRINPK
eukprot:gene11810-15806_t